MRVETRRIQLVCLLGMLPVLAPLAAGSEALTLEAALAEALEANPRVRQAIREAESARAEVIAARSALLPGLDLEAGYTRTEGGQTIDFAVYDPQTGEFQDQSMSIFPEEQWNASVTLGSALYDGGRSWAALRAARRSRRGAEAALEATRRTAVLETVEAWYGLWLAESRQDIAHAGLDAAREHHRRTEALVEQGLLHRADLLRAGTREASLEQALAAAEGGVRLAGDILLRTMGRALGDLPDLRREALPDPPPVPPLEAAILAALESAPEIRQAEQGRRAARAARGIARASFLPRLDGFASTGFETEELEDASDSDVTRAGLSLSLSLFSGWGDRARTRQAELAEEIAAIALEDLRRGIELAVRAAHQDMVVAHRRRIAADLGLESAREAHRMTEERFGAGLASSSDVLDAQEELIRAQTDRVQALHDLHIARARLARYTGEER